MFCIKCGKPVSDEAKFCEHCGSQIPGVDDAPAPVTSTFIPTTYSCRPEKKKFLVFKIFGVCILAIVILLGLFSCVGSDSTEQDAKQDNSISIPESTVAPSLAPTEPATTSDNSTASSDVSVDTAIYLIESTLAENFENVTVSYENEMIQINIWSDGVTTGAMLAKAGDKGCLESWTTLVGNQEKLCKQLYELVQTLGIEDVSVVMNVLNDTNLDNVLLTVLNGYTFYDVVNDK